MKVPIEKWSEVERWLLAVLDFPESERDQILDQICPAELRPLIRNLIRGLEDPSSQEGYALDDDRIHQVVATAFHSDEELLPTEFDDEGSPDEIGHYRIIRRLGKGGMGIVYLCERDMHGEVRQGALKILRSDLHSDDAILRFRRERVLMAAVTSPHVPSLLDAGTTADGRPFFVMEFIDGEPITDYVRRTCPSLEERLDLIEEVCEAVQHLHSQLIIHRDIKPANLFVTVTDGTAKVKLLDFGVSTFILSDEDKPSRSLLTLTQDGTAPHTPEFAAPEQKTGGASGRAVDIYALGVLCCLLSCDKPTRQDDRFPFCAMAADSNAESECSPLRDEKMTASSCRLGGICPVAAHPQPERRFASIDDLAIAIKGLRRYGHSSLS